MYLILRCKKTAGLIGGFIIDLLFPLSCLGCGADVQWLCPDCTEKIRRPENGRCFYCGREASEHGLCAPCRAISPLDGLLSGGRYDDPLLKNLIKAYKYRFAGGMADTLSKRLELAAEGLNVKSRNRLLVPVPLHARRRRWRGFNQAEELARALARELGARLDCQSLVRRRPTRVQANLDKAGRARNVAGAFAWTGHSLAGECVLLVDDVATSGATLEACARELKLAGAGEVVGLVVAK